MLGTDLMEVFGTYHQVMGLSRAEFDITNPEQCRARIGDFGPDAIINAAALTRVDYCESHEQEAFSANADGARNLAEAASAAGSILVHYSTDYIFDGRKTDPYVEEDLPNPQSVYGKSKLRGEELVRAVSPNHLILRTSWVFGRNGKNFIRTILGAGREQRTLRVVHDQRGSPSYTRDLASQTQRMLLAGCRGVYHLTNSGSCTWYELATAALAWAGLSEVEVLPVTTAEYPLPTPRPANSVLANARLQREGLQVMRSWQEAAREYVQTYLRG